MATWLAENSRTRAAACAILARVQFVLPYMRLETICRNTTGLVPQLVLARMHALCCHACDFDGNAQDSSRGENHFSMRQKCRHSWKTLWITHQRRRQRWDTRTRQPINKRQDNTTMMSGTKKCDMMTAETFRPGQHSQLEGQDTTTMTNRTEK